MTHRQGRRSTRWLAWSAGLALLLLTATEAPAGGPAPGETVEIPLKMVGGHPQVDVLIDGEGPFPFVLDTGASVNVIDSGIARELGLEVIGEESVGAPGMEQIPSEVVRAGELQVQRTSFADEELVVMDVSAMSGGTFLGVLRFGIFSESLVALDLGSATLRLSGGSLEPEQPGVVSYEDDDGLIDLPISIGDRQFAAHLDTGSPGTFTLPDQVARELSFLEEPEVVGMVKLVGGQGTASSATLDGTLAVGPLRYENPIVTILDLPVPKVNLGSGFLADRIVHIDHRQRLILFEPAPAGRVVSNRAEGPSGGRRLGLRPAPGPPGPNGLPLVDGGLLVDRVDPGSLAAEAGVRKGDSVLRVNDMPMADYDMESLAALFRSSDPLRMEVRRGASEAVETIEIP